ncbi:MAG: hydroxymethylbilane synthase [Dehalococcoidia bacterium]|nr:hydroxymethylbilane synthase [Dehalococcoidia bacterium]
MASPNRTIVIGTRGSDLAMRQTHEALAQLQAAFPNVPFRLATVAVGGDLHPETPIVRLGVGAFVKELEVALLRHEIDLAVHSLKDMPTSQPDGLVIAAVTRREDPRDVLVDRWDLPLDRLPTGARIGTGSPRRAAQLLHLRPDLNVAPVRGNVATRLAKARGNDLDGVVVALAGLRRLGLEKEAAQVFAPETMLPAPGQGALALEIRQDDKELAEIAGRIQDAATAASVLAERALLAHLGGGCRAPFGAYASLSGDTLTITAMLAEEDGKHIYHVTARGSASNPEAVAQEAYRKLMETNAARLVNPTGGAP